MMVKTMDMTNAAARSTLSIAGCPRQQISTLCPKKRPAFGLLVQAVDHFVNER